MADSEQLRRDRDNLAAYLRKQFLGPIGGPQEELPKDSPAPQRYLMGTLFPKDVSHESFLEGEEVADEQGEGEGATSAVSLAYQKLPASMGLSFRVSGSGAIRCSVHGARYRRAMSEKKRECWKREPLAPEEEPEKLLLDPAAGMSAAHSVLQGRACLHALWRRTRGCHIVTITLMNASTNDSGGIDYRNCLSQVGFTCQPLDGKIMSYPVNGGGSSLDDEEADLAILYRHRSTYAIGHGCAADWERNSDGRVVLVRTEFMPSVEVPGLTTDISTNKIDNTSADVLGLVRLGDDHADSNRLAADLGKFVDAYADWRRQLPDNHIDIPQELHDARDRLLCRIDSATRRMRAGIDALKQDALVRKAFALANRAMLMQMVHQRSATLAGTMRDRTSTAIPVTDYRVAGQEFRWRPFQLAFLLLAIESVFNHNSPDRDVVDLIWFPTGGGKTEAYLALAAFEIFLRRLRGGGETEGTVVVKRYTLRLLTSQQFQRAATLVCACDLIRREEGLGGPISLGLWVGGEASPNDYVKAKELHTTMRNASHPDNPFQLHSCPWCGTRLVPRCHSDDNGDYGIIAESDRFGFFCPSAQCQFHEGIPVTVVDEDIYKSPPTFLIGTIDKFARIAWDHRSSALFGGKGWKPPSLIIQDELHLISGPLGTIAGIYESAIETVIRHHGSGSRPKYIAATATIRRAAEQARLLYGREVAVFPPSGLSADDSYFARADTSVPGRLYLGAMGQGHTPLFSLVQASAALLQAPIEVAMSPKACDSYWTQIIFHNSRRELGKTMTLARDDIPARIKVIATDQSRMRRPDNVEELSANVPGKRIPEILDRLTVPKGGGRTDALDILPCTNMLSVGVDVKRLGQMIVNGQPKATAEYIQASSRVGRAAVPGLVLALYSGTKPRDRSHYEGFRSYHEALYRAVEPTSVTPYALPARERALHAALVATMRLAGGLAEDDKADRFDPEHPEVRNLIEALKLRVRDADPASALETIEHIDALVSEWEKRIRDAQKSGTPLRYEGKGGRQFRSLLCTFEDRREKAWPTLNSMRNVDSDCVMSIRGEDK